MLTSPGHPANILSEDYSRAAVSKCPHIKHRWNSLTAFSGPKFFDMSLRGHNEIKHLQANVSNATDFKESGIMDKMVALFVSQLYNRH